jgi:sporulation protein YlmC with PRC-barrel domain
VAAGKIRASKLIGTKLVNRSNENVGTIGDLVIDSDSGQVEYAAVSFGGFLGMGDKWFAVPMEAIKVETLPNSGQSVLVLNVTKQQMEGAVGFDDASWPNFADPQFTNDLYRRFEVKRRGPFSVDRGGVDVNIGNGGVSVDLERQRP